MFRVFWGKNQGGSQITEGWKAEALQVGRSGQLSNISSSNAKTMVKRSSSEASFAFDIVRANLDMQPEAVCKASALAGVFLGIREVWMDGVREQIDAKWKWDTTSGEQTDWKQLVF